MTIGARCRWLWLGCLGAWCGLVPGMTLWGAAWTGASSPHDRGHLLVVRPSGWLTTAGEPAVVLKTAAALADPPPAPIVAPLSAPLAVRQPGKYQAWIRLSLPPRSLEVVRVNIEQSGATPLRAILPLADAVPQHGGPAGYAAFAKQAAQTGVSARFEEKSQPIGATPKRGDPLGDLLGGKDDLLADLEAGQGSKKVSWAHETRLESDRGERPFYWYRVGAIELRPGETRVSIEPTRSGMTPPPTVDTFLLTTVDDFEYPFIGDLDAPPASYVRFRIGPAGSTTPATGKNPAVASRTAATTKVNITGSMRVHYDPFSTGVGYFNPQGLSKLKGEPHVEPGYTRWYRLQDIERAPGFGAVEAHLTLRVSTGTDGAAGGVVPTGATQFAVFPHDDYVLREIDWQEPEGLRISLLTDFQTHLHRLRTFRDHAREDYDKALEASDGRLFPLTRGPLYFGNAWGAADGETTDYMVKTFRLLGFNCVGQSREPVVYRNLYGWTSHAGHYWPPSYLPYDEAASRARYDEHYARYFDRDRAFYEGVTIFQVADEPGEIAREAMTAPLWRFETTEQAARLSPPARPGAAPRYPQGRWRDLSGDSELITRRTDLSRYVLEGAIERTGPRVGFIVGVDNARQPTRFAYWNLGLVSTDRTMNLAAGRRGFNGSATDEGLIVLQRPAAALGTTPAAFKIVYDGPQAALFINGRLVHQHDKLPEQGGLGIVGGTKILSALRLRPLKPDERLGNADAALAGADAPSAASRLLGENDLDSLLDPAAAASASSGGEKSLEQLVRDEFVQAGGVPAAHEAFRAWARQQGLEPGLFGARSWDDVHLLTLAEAVSTPEEARLFYWSRRFSGWLTPRMFGLSAEAIQRHAPNRQMLGFVALSGHSLYFPSSMPLDMFQLGGDNPAMMAGISDWMSTGGWQWDSHQAVAYSVAPFNAGARRYPDTPGGARPEALGNPMMHCVWPSEFRAFTMLANQVKYVSFYNFGPSYMVTEGHWNDAASSYAAVQRTANRAAQVDDLLGPGQVRPSRVALLYSRANEYWNSPASFADKRATFLALSHEYYQPELITEEQLLAGALAHYDALYVLDPVVAQGAQQSIAAWVRGGGLLWTCADALRFNEFNEPLDGLATLTGIRRRFERDDARPVAKSTPPTPPAPPRFSPRAGQAEFLPHTVAVGGLPLAVEGASARVRGTYEGDEPAWLECDVERGRVVYLRHRCGSTYTAKAIRRGGFQAIWSDTGRAPLTVPLVERSVHRELSLSEPCIVAAPLSTEAGTVIVLFNMIQTGSRNVRVELAEQRPPVSVERFDGLTLVPVPFEHRKGRVHFTLDELDRGQMIVVRRTPAPVDDRLTTLEQTTRGQLARLDDPRSLAAGAWTAGFFPAWGLTRELQALVEHARWDVRRAAVESLARLEARDSSEALFRRASGETDSHVLAELIVSLARLNDPRTVEVATRGAGHPAVIVRRAAALAGIEWSGRHPSEPSEPWCLIARRGADDLDLRVRGPSVQLLARLDPAELVARSVDAYRSGAGPAEVAARGEMAQALGREPAARAAYVQAGFPGGDALLAAVAQGARDPALAEELMRRLPTLSADVAQPFVQAAIHQRHAPLARAMFAAREKLPAPAQSYLPVLLEHTFAARIGEPLDDWAAFLAQ